jgi:hypothetical protein
LGYREIDISTTFRLAVHPERVYFITVIRRDSHIKTTAQASQKIRPEFHCPIQLIPLSGTTGKEHQSNQSCPNSFQTDPALFQ